MKRPSRRPRLTSPLAEARNRVLRAALRPFKWFRPTTRFLIGFFALAILSTLLLARTRSALPSAEVYREGDVVPADVAAPADITSEDTHESDARREAARRDSPPVWNFDAWQIEDAAQSFRASWTTLKQQSQPVGGGVNSNQTNGNANGQRAEPTWPGAGGDRQAIARAVNAHGFDAAALESLTRMLREAGGGYVYDEREKEFVSPSVRVMDVHSGMQAVVNTSQSNFITLEAARERLRGRVSELTGWKLAEREALASAMLPLLRPNVAYNSGAPDAARDGATRAAQPAVVVLKRNQAVAREGDTVTPQMLAQFAAIREYSRTERRPQLFIGLFLFACALYWGAWRFTEYRSTITTLPLSAIRAFPLVSLSSQKPLTLTAILLAVACGLAGGLLTAIFTAGLLPVGESLFGILTDVRLLELSNADLPVLGQLALRAPGTNQHSHAVGQLAEDAARAVGANCLLTRIGALYHDIGKLAAPGYFIENQHGDNPHDHLRPSQSARIITSHVTYGLKLAEEIGLPKQIADFIPQHHGTRTLHFFLRKAQAEAPDGETVDEREFRYPGPKPQVKETAIMMLADSCEAAARSLARPDPESISTIVNKIFDAIVSDGQLDECDLSLRELTKIRETITASLTSIYHARIDYPGFNPPSLDPAQTPLPAADVDSEERGIGYRRAIEVPISKGGEGEDEALTGKGKG